MLSDTFAQQGSLTEGKASVRLASSLREPVLLKMKNLLSKLKAADMN